MRNKDFCVFILTNGRPNKIKTICSLRKDGYTGPIKLIVDDLDKTQEEYKRIYGNDVIVFDKKATAKLVDVGDNFNEFRSILFARVAGFEIAKTLGYKYFIELDDDYTGFQYRQTDSLRYCWLEIKNLNGVFDAMIDFFKSIPANSIAMAQGGDFIGGKNSRTAKILKLKRKCMNSFICSTDRPFKFMGIFNEDVNTYVSKGKIGDLFFTLPNLALVQTATQTNPGGISELYLDFGTYTKSFYTVMFAPSCTKVAIMGHTHRRIHHAITWKNAVPCIIDEKFKKK